MSEKNPKIKKFELEFERNYGKNNEYSRYKILGLKRAYYGPGETDFAKEQALLMKNHL